jgi:hypothetical protein
MALGNKRGTIRIADGGWPKWLRLDDYGITVRNIVQTYRIGWYEVRRFEDGSSPVAALHDHGTYYWALAIVLATGA